MASTVLHARPGRRRAVRRTSGLQVVRCIAVVCRVETEPVGAHPRRRRRHRVPPARSSHSRANYDATGAPSSGCADATAIDVTHVGISSAWARPTSVRSPALGYANVTRCSLRRATPTASLDDIAASATRPARRARLMPHPERASKMIIGARSAASRSCSSPGRLRARRSAYASSSSAARPDRVPRRDTLERADAVVMPGGLLTATTPHRRDRPLLAGHGRVVEFTPPAARSSRSQRLPGAHRSAPAAAARCRRRRAQFLSTRRVRGRDGRSV